jgi:hypothetical protein
MKRCYANSFSFALYAALIAAFILLQPTDCLAVVGPGLTASANPPSGGAGVNFSYLTGSGFPAGNITGATVHFGAACAAPQIVGGPVTQVTTQGVLRRFQFPIPASLAPGAYKVWVSGTVAGAAFNTLDTPSCSTISVTSVVTGRASLGAAIAGANVTLTDVNGNMVFGTTASDGSFTLSTATLTPPFLVKVVTASQSGGFPAGTILYSVSADANASTNINVHVLSDLMVRSFYSAQNLDVDNAFTGPTGINAAPTAVAVQSLANLVIPAVQLWLTNAGVTATGGAPTNDSINLISSPFVAYPPGVIPPGGLDAVLHEIASEAVNGTGAVTGITITGGTITETISPAYVADAIKLSTNTTDSSTGTGSSELFTGLALSGTLQPVIDGINTSLALFRTTINTKGAALTGADLLPSYAPDFVNDGTTAIEDANQTAMDVAGSTINSLELVGINSFNSTTNVADVIFSFNISFGAQTEIGTDTLVFKLEGGTWLQYGNQRIAEASVAAQSRTAQGGQSLGPGVFSGQYVSAGVRVDTSFGVTGAAVSGPVPIWDGALFRLLFQNAQVIEGGRTFNDFFRLSQKLTPGQVPAGTPFTLGIVSPTFGNQQYQVTTNAFTSEVIQFLGISSAPGNGPLSSVVGQTKAYTWTLPQTYARSQVNLFAYIYDGPVNNPASHSCVIGSNTHLDANSTSGSINIPANMSACGLNASVQIQQVNVFLEVEGVNGEQNLVALVYPY